MKQRDLVAVRVLRATIAAIDNAEAPALDPEDLAGVSIEQSPRGAGAREVPRLDLRPEDVRALVQSEIDDRLTAAEGYATAGQTQRARALRAEADVLLALVEPSD